MEGGIPERPMKPPSVVATTRPFFERAAAIVDETWHDLDRLAAALDRFSAQLGLGGAELAVLDRLTSGLRELARRLEHAEAELAAHRPAPVKPRGGVAGRAMATVHLAIGAVLFANEDSILLTDRTLFVAPSAILLPVLSAGDSVVLQYDILDGRNVLTALPTVRE